MYAAAAIRPLASPRSAPHPPVKAPARASARWGDALRLAEALQADARALAERISELSHEAEANAPAARVSAFRWAAGERERISLRPLRHEDIWEFRKKLEGLHWTAQEVDLKKDKVDWDTRMSEDERHFVKLQLAFFSRIDIDVLDNLDENFSSEIDCLEAQMAYAAQKDQECTHTESYSLQIEAVMTGDEREETLNAVRTMPIIATMRNWALQWFDRAIPIGERLIAFAAVEGVLFQASFAALQWLRTRNLLPGITEMNEFIARDEGIHTLLTCLLVREYLIAKPTQERAREIYGSLVAILDVFVEKSLPVSLIGINAKLMKQYVRFQADSVLMAMGYADMYGVSNPFGFMDFQALNKVSKANFFEKNATQYQGVTREGNSRLAVDTSVVEY